MLQETNPFGLVLTDEWLTEIEVNTRFWDQSDELRHIACIAAKRQVSAWALLLALQIHQMSRLAPNVVLVSRNGQPGEGLADAKASSIFAALMADTGGGKSDVIGLASAMIPPAHVVSDGTGQGIAKAFAETKQQSKDDAGNEIAPRQITRYLSHSVVMHCPEVDDLLAEFGREGSKTSGTLRRAWVGEILGSQTGDIARRVTLRPNTYRFAGIWGVQPSKAAPILADAEGGTPQRWCWAPAEEYRDGLVRTPPASVPTFQIPLWGNTGGPLFGTPGAQAASGEMPAEIAADTPLPDPIWIEWSPQMQIDIPPLQAAQKAARRAVREAKHDGRLTAAMVADAQRTMMESHLVLTRIKLAAGHAFLHGRHWPNDADWRLAGVQIEVSKRCLAEAWRESKASAHAALVEKGTDRGVEQFATAASRTAQEQAEIEQHAVTIWKKCSSKPLLARDFRSAWNSRYRPARTSISAAAEMLTDDGVTDGGRRLHIVPAADGRFYAVRDGDLIVPAGHQFTAAPDVA